MTFAELEALREKVEGTRNWVEFSDAIAALSDSDLLRVLHERWPGAYYETALACNHGGVGHALVSAIIARWGKGQFRR